MEIGSLEPNKASSFKSPPSKVSQPRFPKPWPTRGHCYPPPGNYIQKVGQKLRMDYCNSCLGYPFHISSLNLFCNSCLSSKVISPLTLLSLKQPLFIHKSLTGDLSLSSKHSEVSEIMWFIYLLLYFLFFPTKMVATSVYCSQKIWST